MKRLNPMHISLLSPFSYEDIKLSMINTQTNKEVELERNVRSSVSSSVDRDLESHNGRPVNLSENQFSYSRCGNQGKSTDYKPLPWYNIALLCTLES